jgi:psiF repeat
MKIIVALAAAAAIACGIAPAAEPQAAEPPAAPSATPVKHPSLKVCNKQADARHLTGDARAQFVKNCREGKNG